MRRNAAVWLVALVLALSGFAQAESGPQGELTLSWSAQPPAYCEWGASFGASAAANYDPKLPEGTEWYWIDSTYTFSWSFLPDGSGTSTTTGNQSSATGSFSDPNDPCGGKVVAVSVSFAGHIHVDDDEDGYTLDVAGGPATIEFPLVVQPSVKISYAVGHGFGAHAGWPRCQVWAGGSAGPQNGTLTISVLWCNEPTNWKTPTPPTSFCPVAYGPGWFQLFGTYETDDGSSTIGICGNVDGKLVVGGQQNPKTQKYFTVDQGDPYIG